MPIVDGRIELTLKSISRDGTRALVFEPHDVLARLVAAVPPPGFNMLRYFGLLSSLGAGGNRRSVPSAGSVGAHSAASG